MSRLAAQFATLVDEQHDQVVTLDGLVGDTANQVDKAGDHVAQAASRRATLPRVFNAVVLSVGGAAAADSCGALAMLFVSVFRRNESTLDPMSTAPRQAYAEVANPRPGAFDLPFFLNGAFDPSFSDVL